MQSVKRTLNVTGLDLSSSVSGSIRITAFSSDKRSLLSPALRD